MPESACRLTRYGAVELAIYLPSGAQLIQQSGSSRVYDSVAYRRSKWTEESSILL